MAVVAIIIACFVGFIAGTTQIVFLGSTLWEGFLTYIILSATLPTFLALAITVSRLTSRTKPSGNLEKETLKAWNEWHAEEDAELARALDVEKENSRKSA